MLNMSVRKVLHSIMNLVPLKYYRFCVFDINAMGLGQTKIIIERHTGIFMIDGLFFFLTLKNP